MSNPGHADSNATSTAGASQCQTPDRRPEPTGSARHDGAATAPPAERAGDSPAERTPESPVPPICEICRKTPSQLEEYTDAASEEGYEMHPDEYVRSEEGTYNPKENAFFCTECYVKIGMPLDPRYRRPGDKHGYFRAARRPRSW